MKYFKYTLLLLLVGIFIFTGCNSEKNNDVEEIEQENILIPIEGVVEAKISNSVTNGELVNPFIIENDEEGDLMFIETILEKRVESTKDVDFEDVIYIDFVYGEQEGRMIVDQFNNFELYYDKEDNGEVYIFDLDEQIYSHFYQRFTVGY